MWSCLGEVYLVIIVSLMLVLGRLGEELSHKFLGFLFFIIGLLVLAGEGSFLSFFIGWSSLLTLGKLLICFLGGFCMIEELKKVGVEYGLVLLLSLLGLFFLMTSRSLITFYVGLEIQSLSYYVLVSYRRDSSYSTESGLKYFIVGSMFSGLILMGCHLVYYSIGSIYFENLERILVYGMPDWTFYVGSLLLFVGVIFKLSGAPFHQWYIDVLDGSDIRTSRLLSILPKIGMLVFLLRLVGVWGDIGFVLDVLWYCSLLSMLVSVVGCYYQRKVKRFLAYSSIGHIGYLLMCLSSGKVEGFEVMNYLLIYGVMTLGLWIVIEKSKLVYIEELRDVVKGNRLIGVMILIICLSMIGIPPLYGFNIKVDLLINVFKEGNSLIGCLSIFCMILAGFNYLRWLKVVYYEGSISSKVLNISLDTSLILSLFVGMLILMGFC